MNSVVVTGPTGYLGRAIVVELLSSYNVVGISRTATKLLVPSTLSLPGRYIPINADFKVVPVDSIVSSVESALNDIDSILIGLVNNAFSAYPPSSLSVEPLEVSECSEGLFGYPVRLSLALRPLLCKSNHSSIVNISSMYGKISPMPSLYDTTNNMNPLLYGAFKASLIQASRYLSSLLGPSGTRVNSVSFGPFPSQEVHRVNPKFIQRLAAQTHLSRVGLPEEAAGVISFLLSQKASFITGADIAVDGGWTAW